MFVARATTLMTLLDAHRPDLASGLRRIAGAWDGPDRDRVLDQVWPTLPTVAIDHAVAEPAATAGRVAVVPGSFGWDDIGDFGSLSSLLPAGDGSAQVVGGAEVLTERSERALVVSSSDRLIAVLGLDDVVVVDTPDALLVTRRDRVQDVKGLVERLRDGGHADLL
jgi:mannose-1-phosphate guanylyltransferase